MPNPELGQVVQATHFKCPKCKTDRFILDKMGLICTICKAFFSAAYINYDNDNQQNGVDIYADNINQAESSTK